MTTDRAVRRSPLTPMELSNVSCHAANRVVDLVTSADSDAVRYGATWYASVHMWADMAASDIDRSVADVAGIVSLFSQRQSWPRTLRLSAAVLQRMREGNGIDDIVDKVMGRTADRVSAIVNGAWAVEIVRGAKLCSFADNIADPDESDAVTLDTHMRSALLAGTAYAADVKVLERRGMYEAVADGVRMAADYLGYRPLVTQAIAWCAWTGYAVPALNPLEATS